MGVPGFLAAAEPLIAPLDAYFDKVFVMCEDQVRRSTLEAPLGLGCWGGGFLAPRRDTHRLA